MKLYVCWGTFKTPNGHVCERAYAALREAGHDPQVVKAYGAGFLPDALNPTAGRREVKRLTGQSWVPVLVTDDGEAIHDSNAIIAWAKAHPAQQTAAAR